eukprot:Gb_24053 [translate_table: standard]
MAMALGGQVKIFCRGRKCRRVANHQNMPVSWTEMNSCYEKCRSVFVSLEAMCEDVEENSTPRASTHRVTGQHLASNRNDEIIAVCHGFCAGSQFKTTPPADYRSSSLMAAEGQLSPGVSFNLPVYVKELIVGGCGGAYGRGGRGLNERI